MSKEVKPTEENVTFNGDSVLAFLCVTVTILRSLALSAGHTKEDVGHRIEDGVEILLEGDRLSDDAKCDLRLMRRGFRQLYRHDYEVVTFDPSKVTLH